MAMGKLPTRPLGKTGLQVPILAFGASPLGGIYQASKDEVGIEAVHEAFKLGMNFFDTSPHYGPIRSEKVLGQALKSLPRDKYILETKVGRYGEENFDFSAETVTRSLKESLQRLNVDYVDIVHVHDVEFRDLDQICKETFPALQKLKQEGLLRFIGFSCFPLKPYKYIIDKLPEGTVDVILSYAHYSLQNTTLTDIVPYLKGKGIGIVNASPLALGLLGPHGPPEWHPAPQKVKDTCKAAVDAASKRGVDITRLAIQYSLQNEDFATTLVGMHTPEEA
ncbi:hypothetical protein WJX73_005090 [Symbiochloris irregularis]|uniref:NADP-dependent oxidoreductase domain-containing protein n=1 Tax=Symbiochloris irregularis TaxID=706552 RepID=A0AAW1PNC8_9CHLO